MMFIDEGVYVYVHPSTQMYAQMYHDLQVIDGHMTGIKDVGEGAGSLCDLGEFPGYWPSTLPDSFATQPVYFDM
ncbi:MAG: hypothetical protein JSS50_03825 [Proteobacteria bacterium]|nr:hypothetical protein [Pseudomonadota bacterium]